MPEIRKAAIVTGTSSGIGSGLAKALIANGWTVLGLARRPVDFPGLSYTHLQVDLGNLLILETTVIPKLVEFLRQQIWERVALVNNAAAMGSLQNTDALTAAGLAQVYAINSIAPTLLMGCVSRETPETTALRIVNVSTGAVHRGIPGLGDYAASKAALRMSGMTLASEFEQNDRSNAAILSYEPGIVDTEMQRKARSGPEDFPSRQMFREFYASGSLQPVEAVIGDMLEFMGADPPDFFTEKRFGV